MAKINSQTLQEKVVKGSFIAIFFSLFGAIFAYLIKVLYSRTLPVEHFGIFYAVFGFIILVSTYTELGFGEAMSYFIPKHLKNKRYKDLLNILIYGQVIQVGIAIILAIIIAVFAPFLATEYFKVAGAKYLLYIFCIFLVLVSILNSLLQIFTGLQKEKYYSSIYIIRMGIIFLLSMIFLMIHLNNVFYYGLAWVLGYLFTALIFIYLLWNNHPYLNVKDLTWNKNLFNDLRNYALPAFTTTFIYTLFTSSDIFFLTLIRGVKDVGVYSLIVPIAAISLIFLAPLNNVLLPLTSHLMEGEKDKLGFLISKIYQVVPFIGIYFALFIIMFPSAVVGLIFGEKWLGPTQIPLTYLSLGYIALLMSNILGIITLGTGKIKERLKILFFVTILNIIMHAILIYYFGILGAVITNSFTAIILILLYTKILRNTIFFTIPYLFYLELLSFTVLSFLLVKLTHFSPNSWLEFLLSGAIYTGIFSLLGFILKIYNKKLISLIIPQRSK